MVKKWNSRDSQRKKVNKQEKRKKYLKPELIIYGHLEKLTEGSGTRPGEGGVTKTRD